MKLHLGCGKRDFGSDWIHVDRADYPHVKYTNVVDLPFEDNTVEVIYASHLFEYFDREEAKKVLKEWRRVLKPGGILRLAVPDFRALCEIYLSGHRLDNVLGPLYGKMGESVIYHKTCYDFLSLAKVLGDSGFKNVHRYNWRNTEHSRIDDHSQAYFPHMDKENGMLISLNVEAVK